MMTHWLPIESAPRDGTFVLVTGETPTDDAPGAYGYSPAPRMAICYFGTGKWRDQWDDYYGPHNPTHWMPLPDPPVVLVNTSDVRQVDSGLSFGGEPLLYDEPADPPVKG